MGLNDKWELPKFVERDTTLFVTLKYFVNVIFSNYMVLFNYIFSSRSSYTNSTAPRRIVFFIFWRFLTLTKGSSFSSLLFDIVNWERSYKLESVVTLNFFIPFHVFTQHGHTKGQSQFELCNKIMWNNLQLCTFTCRGSNWELLQVLPHLNRSFSSCFIFLAGMYHSLYPMNAAFIGDSCIVGATLKLS